MYTSYVFHFSSHVHSCIDSLSIYGNKSSPQKKTKKIEIDREDVNDRKKWRKNVMKKYNLIGKQTINR